MNQLIKIDLKNVHGSICVTFKSIDVNDKSESVIYRQMTVSKTASACTRGDRRSNLLGNLAPQVLICSTKFLIFLSTLKNNFL